MTAAGGGGGGEEESENEAVIRFRLSNIDSIVSQDEQEFDYRVSPFCLQKQRDGSGSHHLERLREVPVIRIFGATDRGQRVVAHVHGAFPYFYVPYKGGQLDPDTVNAYIYRLGRALNHAIDLTDPWRKSRKELKAPQHIPFIVICKGTPFYGYHVGQQPFLKIYMVNQRFKKRACEALRSGSIMQTTFEIFEEHIPFQLQFLQDMNLYGCGWVEVKTCKFRHPLPEHVTTLSEEYDAPTCSGRFTSRVYDDQTIPSHLLHDVNDYKHPKVSHCQLELDLPVGAILNRHLLGARNLHQDFEEYLRPESIERGRLVHSVKELWDDERRRRSARGEAGPSEVVEDSGSQRDWYLRDPNAPIWQSEEALRAKLETRAKEDLSQFQSRSGFANKVPNFETFVEDSAIASGVQRKWLGQIRTTFEQVDAVFVERLEADERIGYLFAAWAVRGIGSTVAMKQEVDEEALKSSIKGKGKAKEEEEDLNDFDEKSWLASQANQGEEAQKRDGDLDLDDDGGEYYGDEREGGWTEQVREDTELPDEEEDDGDGEGKGESGEEAIIAPKGEEDGTPYVWDREGVGEDGDDGEPPPKRAKRSLSREPSREPFSPAATSLPPPPGQPPPRNSNTPIPGQPLASGPRNPFASPTKAVRVRFAVEDSRPDSNYDEFRQAVDSSPSPSPPPHSEQVTLSHAVDEESDDNLDDLPSDTFDEYQPTPTLIAPAPSFVPHHLRSSVNLLGDESSSQGSSSNSTLPPRASLSSTDEDMPYPAPQGSLSAQSSSASIEMEATPEETLPLPSSAPSIPSESTPSSQNPYPLDLSGSSNSLTAAAPPSSRRIAPNCYIWSQKPPSSRDLVNTIESFGRSRVVYREPFYSKRSDVPKKAREYGGRRFVLTGHSLDFTPEFEHWNQESVTPTVPGKSASGAIASPSWEFGERPPTFRQAQAWLKDTKSVAVESDRVRAIQTAQIEGPTQVQGGFKFVPTKGAPSQQEKQHLALLTMELHVDTRKKKLPDPKKDAIVLAAFCLQSENEDLDANGRASDRHVEIIAVGDEKLASRLGKTSYTLTVVDTELDLINMVIDKTREWDPEIVAGYEVHNASWGYLIERADVEYDFAIVGELGRVIEKDTGRFGNKETDREYANLKFSGRHIFPIWRILAADNRFQRNSFEYAAFSILRQRTPLFSFETLTKWHKSDSPHLIARVFDYWRNRAEMCVEMLEEAEIISQNSESARVFGIDFNSVRTRGSQFKVESIMLRIAKPESFILPSPTPQEVGKQNAAECQALVMEPKSAFYKGPLLVLDFQSLYPSVMIAYNYCYSTCLGRVGTFKGTNKLGTTVYSPSAGALSLLKEETNISPNGLMFVKRHVRKSLLAKMLEELLDTRVMVKAGMKGESGNKALLRLLNARQLALKFIANVTYGYTSATFSGRMPCVEIADAIVQTGRETLEKAMRTIRSTREWGAEVVYGDTDSLFIYLPGKSKADAFKIGKEIADKITSQNPRPIKLKFEKVYLPCVLLAKKRYVGFKYETERDLEPEFDAKGIETVRRDGIPAVQKMQEACIKVLFRTSDLSLVKEFCQRQWRKMMNDQVSPQDFTYAKEVRLGSYSTKGPPPAGAAVAARLIKMDHRAEPAHGERVPYILIQSEPGLRQVDRAVSPGEFLAEPRLRLDAPHYIKKAMIPPLSRIFNLVGVNVESWYSEMEKTSRVQSSCLSSTGKAVALDDHFVTDRCLACGGQCGDSGLCDACQSHPAQVAHHLAKEARVLARHQQAVHAICASCSATPRGEPVLCESLDCPVLYDRKKADNTARSLEGLLSNLTKF